MQSPRIEPVAARAPVRSPPGRGVPHGRDDLSVDAERVERSTWQAVLGPPALSLEELSDLKAVARLRIVSAGGLVFARDDPARAVSALLRGDVALGHIGADKVFHPRQLVFGARWLDVASAWLGGVHAEDAVAQNDVLVAEIASAAMHELLAQHVDMPQRLLMALARQVHDLTAAAHDLMHKDAEGRLAAWLAQRCKPVPESPGTAVVELHERKRDIASQLGITPETLSRLMRALGERRLLEVRGYTVRVLDCGALRRLASGA